MSRSGEGSNRSVVLELDGVQWASQAQVVTAVLGRRPGVLAVDPNPVAQTATVTYDPARTTVEDLSGWVRDCGYHCRGESVPDHLPPAAPAETTGHGAHGEMSMAAMARDMRNRFIVAAVLGVVVVLWSPVGRGFGFTVSAPFGLRDDMFALIVSLPVVFYSAQIFFSGAIRA
ncbi:MAG: P-type Cu2+ transporter, partial [Frankiales bacterium]|nr:P-type Cu2+ transporter [Frankiales bacterium]